MCTPVNLDTEVIVKSLAVVISLILVILLPAILHEQTHRNAVKEQLLPEEDADPVGHAVLEKLFEWRDLIAAVLTGIFILEFAAVDRLTSECVAVAIAAHVMAFGLVPVMLLICTLLINKLGVRHGPSKAMYWLLFSILVVPWYGASVLFVVSP